MHYSITAAVTFKRTLAVLAISALVFGPFSQVFAQSTPEVCESGFTGQFPNCTPLPIAGCTNPKATNFNELAVLDDESCTFAPEAITGCMEKGANNYNANATISDDSCVYEGDSDVVQGCMDESATNYNPQATQSNKSCVYATCKAGENLLANGSFETPVVKSVQGWDIFDSAINGLTWAVSWINPGMNAPVVAKLELQNARPASKGSQYAELDSNYTHPGEAQLVGDARVKISQVIATLPGSVYTLTYDFSALPGHGRAGNNKVQVLINGVVVDTQTASLPHGAVLPVWTHRAFSFTATGTSTEVALADAGKSNTFGTLIDNVSLTTCVVAVVDICPNIEGTQTSVPVGDVVNSDGLCVSATPIAACKVNVVSDETNTVTEKAAANAVLTWVHPAWLMAIPSSTAKWIWGYADVQNPTQTETETFVKTFTWNGPATSALLKIATDNSYVVKLNGTQVAADPAGDNFTTADSVNVLTNIITGQNTLEISVTNTGVAGSDSKSNPAGLLYDLSVIGNTETDCTKVSNNGGGSGTDMYKLYGNIWNDTDKNNVIDNGEANLSGWTVRIVNASNSDQVYTTQTDANGHYEQNVPAGTWIISELTLDGWVLLSVADGHGTYTVTVPTPVVMTLMNWLVSTAEAATLNSFGPYNFGNIQSVVTNTSVTSGGGSSSHRRSLPSSNSGQVLGDSTLKSTPTGEVLGASTSTLPVGAPNTGAGGTSPLTLPTLNAILATRVTARKAK